MTNKEMKQHDEQCAWFTVLGFMGGLMAALMIVL